MNPDSTPTANPVLWYYADNGNTLGPVPLYELESLYAAGTIHDETPVVPEGREDWQQLSSLLINNSFTPQTREAIYGTPPLPLARTHNTTRPKSLLSRWLLGIAIAYGVLVIGHLMTRQPAGHASMGFLGLIFLAAWAVIAASISRKGVGWILGIGGGFILACLTLIASTSALSPFMPVTGEPTSRTSQSQQKDSKPWKPTPAKAYAPPTVNPQQKLEILALFEELQSFRNAPEFHTYGFSKAGQMDWRNRVNALRESARVTDDSGINCIKFAANALDALGMEYLRKKGLETDSARLNRETIEEQTGLHEVVTKRRPSDFEGILSGHDKTVIGGVRVTNAVDMIAETLGQQIDRTLTERFLMRGDTLEARLTRYDDGFLYYVTNDSKDRQIPFALRRTPDIEGVVSSSYPNPSELYEQLIKGEATKLDPLKQGHVLITSGTTMVDLSADKKGFNDYKEATSGKLDQFGKERMTTTICRVRVNHLSGD